MLPSQSSSRPLQTSAVGPDVATHADVAVRARGDARAARRVARVAAESLVDGTVAIVVDAVALLGDRHDLAEARAEAVRRPGLAGRAELIARMTRAHADALDVARRARVRIAWIVRAALCRPRACRRRSAASSTPARSRSTVPSQSSSRPPALLGRRLDRGAGGVVVRARGDAADRRVDAGLDAGPTHADVRAARDRERRCRPGSCRRYRCSRRRGRCRPRGSTPSCSRGLHRSCRRNRRRGRCRSSALPLIPVGALYLRVPVPSARHTVEPVRAHTPSSPFVHAVPMTEASSSTSPLQLSSRPLQTSVRIRALARMLLIASSMSAWFSA